MRRYFRDPTALAAAEYMYEVMMARTREGLKSDFGWTGEQVKAAMACEGAQFALIWNSGKEPSVDQAR